jgi:calcium binding protein 39
VSSLIAEDLLYILASSLHRLPFEARKDGQTIFSYVLRFRPPSSSPKSDPLALSYIINNRPEVLIALCNGYDHKESVTAAGTVLREVLKHESATAIILYDDGEGNTSTKGLSGIHPEVRQTGRGVFWKFFEWINQSAFETSTDSFTTFRVGLPRRAP